MQDTGTDMQTDMTTCKRSMHMTGYDFAKTTLMLLTNSVHVTGHVWEHVSFDIIGGTFVDGMWWRMTHPLA